MARLKQDSGYALITALIVTAIATALVVGFISQVNMEQKIARNDTDYSGAFYGSEAGLEKMNSDLSKLFIAKVFPSQADLAAIQVAGYRPSLSGVTYTGYSLVGGQSARLTAPLTAGATTATVDATAVWPALDGFFMIDAEEFTYAGKTATTFTGLVRAQNGSIAAAHSVNATVFRSSVVTLSEGPNAGLSAQTIPFTLDITARAGVGADSRLTRQVQVALIPVFQFGLFSESDLSFFAGPDFDFGGRVHSNGNIFLAHGDGETLTLAQKVTSAGQIIRAVLANGVATSAIHDGTVKVVTTPGNYRNLGLTEGSLLNGGAGPGVNPLWNGLSMTTYNQNILSAATGGRPLTLPFVAAGFTPIELIKRPPAGEAADSLIGQSRLANQATIKVLISDAVANLPGGVGYALNNSIANYNSQDTAGPPAIFRPPFAEADKNDPDFIASDNADENADNVPLINGFIYIGRQNADATWTDVTLEILKLGISTSQPDAILRFQKPRWDLLDSTNSLNATDYLPINMFDAREGRFRDDFSTVGTNLRKLGIMNVVELNVNNLRRWFAGVIGTTGNLAVSNSGYIFYFSDRRGNRNSAGNETGEFGFEDFVNPASLVGDPNGTLETGEDLNGNGTVEVYGANLALPSAINTAGTDLYNTSIPTPVAAAAIDLGEPLDNAETAIEVTSATNITVPGYYRIDNEIVNCASKAGNTLTCTRGQLGTAAVAHVGIGVDLDEDLDAVETAFAVGSDATIVVPAYYRIGNETVLCVSKSANVLTCERAKMGTTAAAHNRAANSVIEALDIAETSINITDVSGLSVPKYFRVDSEIMYCTAKNSAATPDTMTCARGALGTAAAIHTYASTLMDTSINSSTTIFKVTNNTVLSLPVPANYRIDNEIVYCTVVNAAPSNDHITCARGKQGTTAVSHNSGVIFQKQVDIRLIDIMKVTIFTSERASKNRVHYFRHALRLVNGTSPNLPTPGFTVAAENPVYILGNYNSNGTPGFTDSHSYSAVIADAVSLLSVNWSAGGDDRSFIYPYDLSNRPGDTTWYRMAIASGKGINFPKPANATPSDFGTDGGAHNFLRYLEKWSGTSNYRGSIVSLYYYRQAVGPYKCCGSVYDPPERAYAFDTDFLVPSQLPPGTPRFRDINNLSFRQTIRAD